MACKRPELPLKIVSSDVNYREEVTSRPSRDYLAPWARTVPHTIGFSLNRSVEVSLSERRSSALFSIKMRGIWAVGRAARVIMATPRELAARRLPPIEDESSSLLALTLITV